MKNILLIFIFLALKTNAQTIEMLNSNSKASLRGLSVVDENIIWASGNNGTVLKSTNAGKTFETIAVKGFEKNDFRDIEAFDSNTAIIMAIAEPAYILKTIDGGVSWNIVFKDTTKGMFLDAMFFKNEREGMVVGDPILATNYLKNDSIAFSSLCFNPSNKIAYLLETNDNGNSWKKSFRTSSLDSNEAFFASSGSNIFLDKKDILYVSGGSKSNLYFNKEKFEIPIVKGLESTGANSISIFKNKAIIVGGDFAKDSIATNNCVLFDLKSKEFNLPQTNPTGYRSCISQINKKLAFACGINGVDVSNDGGINWKQISKTSFHVVAKAKKGKAIFLAGGKGRIGKIKI